MADQFPLVLTDAGELEQLQDGDALNADVAGNAATADHATTADSAVSAGSATNATNADHATAADSATNADHATAADSATNADHATTADTATTATTAVSATTAARWASARSITLDGDVTGSGSIDGSANITITTTISANSITPTELNVAGNGGSTNVLTSDGAGGFTWLSQNSLSVGQAAETIALTQAQGFQISGDVVATSIPFDGTSGVNLVASISANAVGASALNVAGNGTVGQHLISDGDGSFSWRDESAMSVDHATTAETATASSMAVFANTSGHANTSDSATTAATATALATARTIGISGDVSAGALEFDGTGNITLVTSLSSNVVTPTELNVTGNGTALQHLVSDGAGGFNWRSESLMDVGHATSADSATSATSAGHATTADSATTATTADSATTATTAVSANSATTAASADEATALSTPRTFSITGDVTASGIAFDGTGNVTLSATIAANAVTPTELNITGNGNVGQVMASDGAGGFTWADPGAGGGGTVTNVASGDGMDFSAITGTGAVTLGTPSTLTASTANALTATSHTHAITTSSSGAASTIMATDASGNVAVNILTGAEVRSNGALYANYNGGGDSNVYFHNGSSPTGARIWFDGDQFNMNAHMNVGGRYLAIDGAASGDVGVFINAGTSGRDAIIGFGHAGGYNTRGLFFDDSEDELHLMHDVTCDGEFTVAGNITDGSETTTVAAITSGLAAAAAKLGSANVYVIHTDGSYSEYKASADNDTARGAALSAAVAASSQGEFIYVNAGTYNVNNILANGRSYHFCLGAVVTYTGTTGGAIFADGGNDWNFHIDGYGDFIHVGVNATGDKQVFNLTGNTNATIRCRSIVSSQSVAVRLAGAGSSTVRVFADEIISSDGTIDNLSGSAKCFIVTNRMISFSNLVIEMDGGETHVFGVGNDAYMVSYAMYPIETITAPCSVSNMRIESVAGDSCFQLASGYPCTFNNCEFDTDQAHAGDSATADAIMKGCWRTNGNPITITGGQPTYLGHEAKVNEHIDWTAASANLITAGTVSARNLYAHPANTAFDPAYVYFGQEDTPDYAYLKFESDVFTFNFDVEFLGPVLTNIINERSNGSGVTIDGLLIQDGGIPAGAVTAHEASITHDNLSGAGTNTHAQIDTHLGSTSNPHSLNYVSQITDDGSTFLDTDGPSSIWFSGQNGLTAAVQDHATYGLIVQFSLDSGASISCANVSASGAISAVFATLPTMLCSTIYEASGGTGVTIDSLLVKDGVPVIDEALQVVFDGGGSVIASSSQVDLIVPYDMTITSWSVLADQSGSIVVDVWEDTFANFPPTDADTITGAEPPTLSSQQAAQDTSLNSGAGWDVTKGNILRFNVDSATTVERVTVVLHGVRR